MSFLDDRFELYLLLVGGGEYVRELRAQARRDRRIQFPPPVAPNQIVETLNQYDVGIVLVPPTSTNILFALPNKLFEFIQARLVVAVGPSPEMARVVREHNVGVVSGDYAPKSMAKALASLTWDDIKRFKYNSHRVAEQLSFDVLKKRLASLVEHVIPDFAD
jgi:glycosyltransferase involved in cell wall biosynthesis